jgi:hypothetical protein
MKERRGGLENIIALNAFRIIIHSRAPVALFFSRALTHSEGSSLLIQSAAKREISPFNAKEAKTKRLEVHFISSHQILARTFGISVSFGEARGAKKEKKMKLRSPEFNYG